MCSIPVLFVMGTKMSGGSAQLGVDEGRVPDVWYRRVQKSRCFVRKAFFEESPLHALKASRSLETWSFPRRGDRRSE